MKPKRYIKKIAGLWCLYITNELSGATPVDLFMSYELARVELVRLRKWDDWWAQMREPITAAITARMIPLV